MMPILAAVAASAVLLAGSANAHGWLSQPLARNGMDSCKHCLAMGGAVTVNANLPSYRVGMCGNSPDDAVQV